MLAAGLVDLPREALAQLLRGRGNRIEQSHDAPQVVALLGQMQRAAPAVEPHELRHRDPVAEREGADQEAAQVAAGALDDGERFRHGELQQRVAPLGVQALGHHLDRLEREVERRVAAGDALCLHLRGETR